MTTKRRAAEERAASPENEDQEDEDQCSGIESGEDATVPQGTAPAR